jgi:hypothetical protein
MNSNGKTSASAASAVPSALKRVNSNSQVKNAARASVAEEKRNTE